MKSSVTLSIRLLRLDYIEKVVDVHISAFHGYLNTKIGKAYLRNFFYWFSSSDEAIALCAIDQTGEIIGYVVGAITSYGRALKKYLMPTIIAGILTHFWVLFNPRFIWMVLGQLGFRRKLKVVTPQLPRPTISLIGIGVSPEFRGLGVGKRLVTEFEKISNASGYHSLYLSVYPSNTAARKLYEKAGWQPGPEPEYLDEAMYYTKIIS